MKHNKNILLLLLTLITAKLYGQDDLLKELDSLSEDRVEYTIATFKGSRLINGHSVEMRNKKVLEFLISHRFGRLNSGAYQLFGLDESNIRLALEYGLTDRLNIGIGRSSFKKIFDGFLKYKFLRQSSGAENIPFSIVGFANTIINTIRPLEGETIDFTERLQYTSQLLIARKFSDKLSFQLMPTIVHKNIVEKIADDNTIYVLGAGGRYKFTNSVALNLEYYYQFNPLMSPETYNSIAIGFDIETGGHVFQLHLTNARSMIEQGFITENTGDFFDGDIHFGFNISRVFDLSPGKSKKW